MKNHLFISIIAFTSGAVTMIIELLSARLISIYFGHDLYIWTIIVGVTMFGLAVGYYCGGWFSEKYDSIKFLKTIILIITLYIIILPMFASGVLEFFFTYNMGALWSSLFFLFPIMALLGMIAPVSIKSTTSETEKSGIAAGNFFAISSTGSILSTFISGFFLIPNLSINTITFSISVLFLFLLCLYQLSSKKFVHLFTLSVTAIICTGCYFLGVTFKQSTTKKIIHQQDGVLGQIIVEDKILHKHKKQRILYIDRAPNSVINPSTKISDYSYVHKVASMTDIYPQGSKALVMGVGGGSSVIEFARMGFNVEAVELDKNVASTALHFFGLKEFPCKIYIDDARHFIRTAKSKYDIIFVDIIGNENIPSHLYTLEGVKEMDKILNPYGTIYLYFFGSLEGEKSMGIKSLLKTFREGGFVVKIHSEVSLEGGMKIITATKILLDEKISLNKINVCCGPTIDSFMEVINYSFEDGNILVDDKPILSIFYKKMMPEYKVRHIYWVEKGK